MGPGVTPRRIVSSTGDRRGRVVPVLSPAPVPITPCTPLSPTLMSPDPFEYHLYRPYHLARQWPARALAPIGSSLASLKV